MMDASDAEQVPANDLPPAPSGTTGSYKGMDRLPEFKLLDRSGVQLYCRSDMPKARIVVDEHSEITVTGKSLEEFEASLNTGTYIRQTSSQDNSTENASLRDLSKDALEKCEKAKKPKQKAFPSP